jgi:hypothetical protein
MDKNLLVLLAASVCSAFQTMFAGLDPGLKPISATEFQRRKLSTSLRSFSYQKHSVSFWRGGISVRLRI